MFDNISQSKSLRSVCDVYLNDKGNITFLIRASSFLALKLNDKN